MLHLSPETLEQLEKPIHSSHNMQSDLEELQKKKEQNLLPSWETITQEQLKDILISYNPSNSFLAELFGVTKSQISYKRKKWNLTSPNISYERVMQSFRSRDALQELLLQDLKNVDTAVLSKAIVHYIFRNGPVEDMHADGKLSQEDMKTLNQYMMDRVATLITLFKDKDYMRLLLFLDIYQYYGTNWDAPKLQTEELDKIFKIPLSNKP